ncbi:MAG: lipopolysaccharide transport periplasmic protein LptA [Syntrophales bacterium]
MTGDAIRKTAVVGILLALIVAPAGVWGQAKPKGALTRNQPLQVDADRLDAYSNKRIVVFSGNVVASQGGRTIHAERLTVHYKDDKKASGASAAAVEDSGSVERIEAEGKVTIREGGRVATGDVAVFDQEAQKITMTGDAVLKEGKNIIKGDRVVIFLEENRGVVEGVEKRRVSATIYPGDKQ